MILGKQRTYYVRESVCLDPELCDGAVHIVWVKVASETELNWEKRLYEVLLCPRDVRQREKYFVTRYCRIKTRSVRYN